MGIGSRSNMPKGFEQRGAGQRRVSKTIPDCLHSERGTEASGSRVSQRKGHIELFKSLLCRNRCVREYGVALAGLKEGPLCETGVVDSDNFIPPSESDEGRAPLPRRWHCRTNRAREERSGMSARP